MSLSLSNNGFEFLKSQEGCVLTAYKLEGETYYIYRAGDSGNKLVGTTAKQSCTVKAVVGDNMLYAKAISTNKNTATITIHFFNFDFI